MAKKRSLFQVALEIAREKSCKIQKNGKTLSIYNKNGGWEGAVCDDATTQGIALAYKIEWDNEKGWILTEA